MEIAEYNGQNRPIRFTRENADGTRTVITAAYDYMGRRAWKKVETIATDAATGEETSIVTLHQRYIYRGYLQVAACDLTRGGQPCLWLITWDPTQPVATRPLAIQKDGRWYCYGRDLTKNVCEVCGQEGFIRTIYVYTPPMAPPQRRGMSCSRCKGGANTPSPNRGLFTTTAAMITPPMVSGAKESFLEIWKFSIGILMS